ncbi:MAG: MXAN_2562 family outer membrane beta-barrel protein [Proteobacteria bacterium]|nr:MXAN_2562 family outer membrane beta-barrel protein [Pseudomonadota bacterium]
MSRCTRLAAALAAASCLCWAGLDLSSALAQYDEQTPTQKPGFQSPEGFGFEFRLGPFKPTDNVVFEEVFSDSGPMLATELDIHAHRLPEIGVASVGLGLGWARYEAGACQVETCQGMRLEEKTTLRLVPFSLLAVARLDALPRRFGVPLVLTAKLGYEWVLWDTATGGVDDASGVSPGFRWALQLAFDLGVFQPRSARMLDEEWGINLSFLFLELYGSTAEGDSLPVGGESWAAGLGFLF